MRWLAELCRFDHVNGGEVTILMSLQVSSRPHAGKESILYLVGVLPTRRLYICCSLCWAIIEEADSIGKQPFVYKIQGFVCRLD